jgi:hypothetical protein
MDAEDKKDESLSGEQEETPVCTKCFRPVRPLDHVCPHCGEAIGQLTPNLPFESIGWQTQTWGRAWRQVWLREISIPGRLFRLLMIVLNAPVLLVGLFWQIRSKKAPEHPGS